MTLRVAERSEALKQALAYPYGVPSTSYTLVGGRALGPDAVQVDLSTRTPLLAYGSNAAPAVLARKLGGEADPVPVVRVVLSDFDVVYSAHISAYGAIPAAIQCSPGTETHVFVAHLAAEQLRRISKTEPNYELRPLPAACRVAGTGAPLEISAFVSRHGCLALDAGEVALTDVPARGRRFPAMSEADVLERVRRELRPDLDLEGFVAVAVADARTARRWSERLRAGARPLA